MTDVKGLAERPKEHDQEYIDQQMGLDDEGLCGCGKTSWEMCDCGDFFLTWQCGMLADGTCTLAGSEDCDWECPRSRALSPTEAAE